jgi:type II secretory pathway component HofQ
MPAEELDQAPGHVLGVGRSDGQPRHPQRGRGADERQRRARDRDAELGLDLGDLASCPVEAEHEAAAGAGPRRRRHAAPAELVGARSQSRGAAEIHERVDAVRVLAHAGVDDLRVHRWADACREQRVVVLGRVAGIQEAQP